MTEERLKLHEKAEVKINAIIDTLSQDKGGLSNKLKQEDVKDFLISLWVDCSAETTKELQEKLESSKRDNEILWERLKKYKEDLKKLRVAFIEAQVMALGGKSIQDLFKDMES